MPYVLNFHAEILLILTYGLGLTDKTQNDSPFHMMWVVGLEVQIMASIGKFPVHFHGQYWTLLHDQEVQESASIVNLMVGLMLLRR
jgi:hypothetical protein